MRLRWGWWVRIPRLVLWDERARFRVRAGWLLAAQRQDVAANNVRTFVADFWACALTNFLKQSETLKPRTP